VTTWDWERVNVQSAIWSKDPKEVGDDDYKSFYKSISKDYADPSTWIHFKVKEEDNGGRVEGRRTHEGAFAAHAPPKPLDPEHPSRRASPRVYPSFRLKNLNPAAPSLPLLLL
jgi:hypothetical protein